MAHRDGEASATAASAATTLEAPEVGGQHEENDGGGGGSSNDLDSRQEQEGQQRPAQSETRGKENDGGRGGQPAPQPPPLSAAKGRARRPGKRPAPFSSFVPKNAQGSGIKRRQLSPSTIQRNKEPTETKGDHDEKASSVSRVKHVPVDDVLGPNSNSMDLYADFLGAMDTSRAVTIESSESDGLDWAERLWMPLDIVAGIRKAATGDNNSDRDLLSLLSHFEYPASQGPNGIEAWTGLGYGAATS
ncbi:Hypothetical Protein FCC1311_076202 [Hondaea fermentalgiana]|uniref:Uncharacterized protein n=1 Tax=Hondaea fermentalgiana TaxID=2315210 RepID=A0A2R5GKF9_9STRA|nr:Hypothetical Protein FCC1311_076202 [Hondaea fermentalgiana]|eukprot:GBG31396.1 Hypothetical Protein FCC1311_076202 [Hondaea fermentalgiana]